MAKTSTSRTSSTRKTQPPPKPFNKDLVGIGLCTLGVICLLCLLWKQGGSLPEYIEKLLRLIAGSGAYVIPVLLFLVGGMYLRGFQNFSLSRSSLGSALFFLVFIGWRHIYVLKPNEYWANESVVRAGGWLGALVGAPLVGLLGHPISYVIFFAFGLVGFLLIVDRPFIEIYDHLRDKTHAGVSNVKEALNAPSKRAIASPDTPPDKERSERAARVAERAVVTSQATSQETKTATAIEHAEISTPLVKMWNALHPYRLQEEEAEAALTATAPEAEPTPLPAKRKPTKQESRPLADPVQLELPSESETETVPLIKPFALPSLTLLKEVPPSVSKRSQEEISDRIHIIEKTLEQFNIGSTVVEVASGPTVTRYEIQLAPGIKVNKIVSLADNLAMSLAAIDVRVEAPIPGKAAIGVEVPNAQTVVVSLRECLDTDEYRNAPSLLTVALGKDVSGQYRYADLTKMPHLLIGGSTNSGKSICLNTLIASLIYRATPRQVRLLMIDPKRVELSLWEGIPHLLHPVVKDVKQAAGIFRTAIKEMERRYDLFAALGTRNLDGYNQKVPESSTLPYIVLIVDELADLMMQQGAEVETQICRLAQLARATGIHLVIATQRPSVDIITGTIKANIASRIAFAVASQIDSRTILDSPGAERLIGRGDMLFMPIDAPKPMRIQGCYLSETETNAIVEYLREQEKPDYSFSVPETEQNEGGGANYSSEEEVDQALFEQAVRLVVNNGQASTSMLQRRFRVGYTRAARIVEMMERRGIVGPLDGARPREILVSKDEVERMFNPNYVPPVFDDEDGEE
ncbi:MAG: DNA translocase FtsK 4TM domain-containing protein [Armatimonadetes bacterium]|nr:DNA translocase FtsK 4TM domain-containing protein [Armatimonadota bacterium]